MRPPHRSIPNEAGGDLLGIRHGDLVLIDRKQASLGRDGIYLLDFPRLELRGVFRRGGDEVEVVCSQS